MPQDCKGPLLYVQKRIPTEVDFTLAHIVNEGKKLGMPMPLSSRLLEIFHKLEADKRQFGQQRYDELVTAAKSTYISNSPLVRDQTVNMIGHQGVGMNPTRPCHLGRLRHAKKKR